MQIVTINFKDKPVTFSQIGPNQWMSDDIDWDNLLGTLSTDEIDYLIEKKDF